MDLKVDFLSRVPASLILFISVIAAQPAFPHPGRTNAEGCHNDRKTGQYHCHNAGSKVEIIPPVATGCEQQPHCYDLTSCADAMHYFKDCGLDRLDRDKDGVPCENICGHHD